MGDDIRAETGFEDLQRMLDNDIIEPLKDRITSWLFTNAFCGVEAWEI